MENDEAALFSLFFAFGIYFRDFQNGRRPALVASCAVSDPSLSAVLAVHYNDHSLVFRPLRLHTHFRSRRH